MSEAENLKRYISELIQEVEQELEEATTTANVDGYQTPYAFSRKKDKERTRKNATQLGYELVDDDVDNISEAGLKGTEKIPSTKKLSQLSDNEKLTIVQSSGNIISFKIPDWAKGRYKNWQVISTGKIKKGKDISDGSVNYFLIGKGPQKASPTYKSVKDLLNGVEWDTMELRRESVNESIITEKQFKGLRGIPANTSLEKITKDQKLKIVKSHGNIIDFIVPKGSSRNFWQVLGTGKIKKNLSGEYYLEGVTKNSPMFKSLDDLIKGVDWKSMEERRDLAFERRESVNESTDDKQKVVDYLVKKGNNKNDAQKMVDKNYDFVSKRYKGASVVKKAEIISGLQESVNESSLKPKKLTQLKKGEKFVFNNTPYEFVELYTDINNAAKVKKEDGKTSVVSFGGGVVNKNTKGGFSNYLKQGGRVWDNVNPTDSKSITEARIKRPVNRWLELKNDETMHPHKKMAHGLKELKYQLAETEKFFRWYNQIKTMNELDSTTYWKRTQNHIYKIKERLINIAKTLQEIEK